ncbi:MAG: phosphoesterase PA-phosphatase, partial [Sphingobacteriaceae bacterium]
MKRFLILIAVVVALSSCKKSDYKQLLHNPALYSKTVHELNSIVMGNNFTPVVASRNYAYANIAAYEVIAAGNPAKYTSLSGQLNELKEVPKPAAGEKIDFEYAALLAFCGVGQTVTFPEGSMQYYTDSLHTMAEEHGMPEEMITASENYAKQVTAAIVKWSKGDNYLKTRSAPKYSVKSDVAGRWIPTPPSYAAAVEPHWQQIRPMLMDSASQFRVPPPPVYNVSDKNSKYYQ